MSIIRKTAVLSTAGLALASAGIAIDAGPARATVQCESSIQYRISARGRQMVLAVSPITFANGTATPETGHYSVSKVRTNTTTFSGSIQGSVEGSFYRVAKASAQLNLGVTLQWSNSYTENISFDVPVPAHSQVTLRYGWMRVNSYVEQYRWVRSSPSGCRRQVLRAGWVESPYTRTYSTSQRKL